jgi:hypothetical protein
MNKIVVRAVRRLDFPNKSGPISDQRPLVFQKSQHSDLELVPPISTQSASLSPPLPPRKD